MSLTGRSDKKIFADRWDVIFYGILAGGLVLGPILLGFMNPFGTMCVLFVYPGLEIVSWGRSRRDENAARRYWQEFE